MTRNVSLSFLRSRVSLLRIAGVTGVALAAGLAYAVLAPGWYQATVTFVPVTPPRGGGAAALLGSSLGGLGAALEGSVVGADAARIAVVLQSNAVTDAAIERFDLERRYGRATREATREDFWRHCLVKTLAKPNLVQLTCEDRDPAFVQELLSFVADRGNRLFRRVSVTTASEEVQFLEKRVAELREQATEAAARLRDFQEKHQVIDLESQTRAVVGALSAVHGQRTAKELEYAFSRSFASPDEAGARQMQSQIAILEEKLRDLEEARPVDGGGGDAAGGRSRGSIFPPAMKVPRLRAELESLYRDRRVAEVTLVGALDRLEAARASEAREASTFLVLDPPTRPTRKARPRLGSTLVEAAALGLVAGVLFAWYRGNPREGRA